MHFAQVPGPIKRSSEVRAGTEQLIRSKKLLVPMIVFANQALPVVAASYGFTARFNPNHEFEQHPASNRAPENFISSPPLQPVAIQYDRTHIATTPPQCNKHRPALTH